MRFVSAEEIRAVLDFPSLIDALAAAHRRPRMETADALLGHSEEAYFVRHAVDTGRFMASKLITSFPANLGRGKIPAVQAVLVLFDGTDGRPLAVMDGTELTYWRTAADSALAAKILEPADARVLLMVGAGELSRWLVRAHCAVRPTLRHILIWNRTASRAAQLAATLAQEGFHAETTTDLTEAISRADIVSTCTRAQQPLVRGALLRPGVHLDLVGGYDPQTREADDACILRARVFVDSLASALYGVGDIVQAMASGALRQDDIRGDLYDLVGGQVAGRSAPHDITLFKNAGGGHLDLMTAALVFSRLAG